MTDSEGVKFTINVNFLYFQNKNLQTNSGRMGDATCADDSLKVMCDENICKNVGINT